MQFGLSESQQILQDSAREFFAGEVPIARVRRLVETNTADDPTLWKKLADQGYTGITSPEEHGGVGLGAVELILLMEEAGRALLPGPFSAPAALAGSVTDACGSAAHKKTYLAQICGGGPRSTLAILETSGSWGPAD